MSARTRKRRAKAENGPKRAVWSILYGSAASAVASLVLILLLGTVALCSPDPDVAARIIGYASFYVSAAVGGFFAFKLCGGYAMLCGLCSGAAFTLIVFALSLFFRPDGAMNAWLAFLIRIPAIAFAVVGAVLAMHRPRKKRHRRRKR